MNLTMIKVNNFDIDDPSTPLKSHLKSIRHENAKLRSSVMRLVFDPPTGNTIDKSHIATALTTLTKAQMNLANWHKLLMKYLRRTDHRDPELKVFIGKDKLLKGTKPSSTKRPLLHHQQSVTSIISPKGPAHQHDVSGTVILGVAASSLKKHTMTKPRSISNLHSNEPKITQKRASAVFASQHHQKHDRDEAQGHLRINSKPTIHSSIPTAQLVPL